MYNVTFRLISKRWVLLFSNIHRVQGDRVSSWFVMWLQRVPLKRKVYGHQVLPEQTERTLSMLKGLIKINDLMTNNDDQSSSLTRLNVDSHILRIHLL